MPSVAPYSLALVVIVLTASIAVLGQGETPELDACLKGNSCTECVVIKIPANQTVNGTSNNGTCVWEVTSSGQLCVAKYTPSQEISNVAFNEQGCATIPSTTTTAAPSTNGTTTAPPTPPPSTNATTTSTTPAPPTNATTTVPTTLPTNATTTPATPTNGTTPITTPIPSNSTTAAPTPAPTKGGFSWASFIGGIVFAAALSSLAYLIWRFYKVRLDRNYHTFSNPTF